MLIVEYDFGNMNHSELYLLFPQCSFSLQCSILSSIVAAVYSSLHTHGVLYSGGLSMSIGGNAHACSPFLLTV